MLCNWLCPWSGRPTNLLKRKYNLKHNFLGIQSVCASMIFYFISYFCSTLFFSNNFKDLRYLWMLSSLFWFRVNVIESQVQLAASSLFNLKNFVKSLVLLETYIFILLVKHCCQTSPETSPPPILLWSWVFFPISSHWGDCNPSVPYPNSVGPL